MAPQETTYTKPRLANPLRSIIEGDESRLKELLKEFEWSPEELGRILWHALRHGTVEAVRMLVEAGADVHMPKPQSQCGITNMLLYVMTKYANCFDLVLLMIRRGADANTCDDLDQSVLDIAIQKQAPIDVLKELVQLGARVKLFSNRVFDHPHAATILPSVFEGCGELVAAALDFCVGKWREPHTRERKWLVWATVFLDMRFPVDELERHGFTLQLAVRTGNLELVRSLMDYGFSVNEPVGYGNSPLYAASWQDNSAITELLLRAGAQLNSRSKLLHECALHAACRRGSLENIKVLLGHGADVNVINGLGVTAFSLIGRTEIMSDAHRIFIRHLAVLVSKEKYVNNGDLLIIGNNPEMRSWYAHCSDELQMIRNFNVFENTSISSFFREEDIRELLFVTRNYRFQKNLTSDLLVNLFPIYGKELALSLKEAKKQKRWFGNRAKALYDSLNSILPDVPMVMIAHYFYMDNIAN